MTIYSVRDCDKPSVIVATIGFGPEHHALTVSHEIPCPLCADHRDATLTHSWNFTLDYDKLELPDELRALIP